MKTTRAQFKLALRYCKQHADMLRADAYANLLATKEYDQFWQSISLQKGNNGKATKHTKVLDGCMGDILLLLTDGGNTFSRYIITPLMNPTRINSIIVLKLHYSNVKVL